MKRGLWEAVAGSGQAGTEGLDSRWPWGGTSGREGPGFQPGDGRWGLKCQVTWAQPSWGRGLSSPAQSPEFTLTPPDRVLLGGLSSCCEPTSSSRRFPLGSPTEPDARCLERILRVKITLSHCSPPEHLTAVSSMAVGKRRLSHWRFEVIGCGGGGRPPVSFSTELPVFWRRQSRLPQSPWPFPLAPCPAVPGPSLTSPSHWPPAHRLPGISGGRDKEPLSSLGSLARQRRQEASEKGKGHCLQVALSRVPGGGQGGAAETS